jgi:hypothetical protein
MLWVHPNVVHPKAQWFFLQWASLIGLSQKNHDALNASQT